MIGNIAGHTQPNGTWTDNLGLVQTGTIDMWAASASMTLERNADFLFTTVFGIEKYGALMKRQDGFSMEMSHVTAGIDLQTYGIMFAIFAFLFIVCLLNERLQQSNERNSTWHLL